MIAIPIQKTKEILTISAVLDRAKWFAFIKDNKIEIEDKQTYTPFALKEWFFKKGVKTIVLRKITNLQYQILREESSMKFVYAGYSRIKMDDAIHKYKNGQLTTIDNNNYNSIIHRF